MAVKRVTVHCLEIEDKPGSLQKLLARAASEDVDLLCFVAFSKGGGKGELCLSAKKTQELESCAKSAQIETTEAAGFVVSGEDKVGAAAEALKTLADAGINGVAGSAMVFDGQYQMLIVVNAEDGDAAADALGA